MGIEPAPAGMPRAALLALSAALALLLILSALAPAALRPRSHANAPRPPARLAGDALAPLSPTPPRRPSAGFCRRCSAACADRRARCAAARPPARPWDCRGIEAACIIRCNEGLGCALPPPA